MSYPDVLLSVIVILFVLLVALMPVFAIIVGLIEGDRGAVAGGVVLAALIYGVPLLAWIIYILQ